MKYTFGKRPYGAESTPEEIQAMRDRICVHGPGILYWRELPVQSLFHLDILEQRLNELSHDLSAYDLIVDLVEASPPGPQIRERLKQIFAAQHKLRRTAVVTGKNFMLNVAAKFVLGGSVGLKNFSIHTTLEQALEELGHGARR